MLKLKSSRQNLTNLLISLSADVRSKPACLKVALKIVRNVLAVGDVEVVLAVWPVSSAGMEFISFVAVQGM